MKAYNAALGHAWAITEPGLAQVLDIASRQNLDLDLARERKAQAELVAKQSGTRLAGTDSVTMRGSVATLPVRGTISPYASLFGDISGATSISALSKDFHAALGNPDVKALVLRIDSPGGSATDVLEFSDMIYEARGAKPIIASVGGQAASAAYLLACACDEIVVSKMAALGSIGVITAIPKDDGEDGDVVFVSSQSPLKRPDLGTKEGVDSVQQMLDDMADEFVTAVARNRGVSAQTVLSDFGQGAQLIGNRAVKAGLADRIGSYEGVVKQLNEGATPMPTSKKKVAAEGAVTPAELAAMSRDLASANEDADTSLSDAVLSAVASGTSEATVLDGAESIAVTGDYHPDAAVLVAGNGVFQKDAAEMAADNAKLAEVLAQSGEIAAATNDALASAMNVFAASAEGAVASTETLNVATQDGNETIRALTEQLEASKQREAALLRQNELTDLAGYAASHEWYGNAGDHARFMYALTAEQREYFQRVMNAQSEQIDKSALFGSVGTSNPTGEFASAVEEYEVMVSRAMTDKHLSRERAMTHINRTHPELVAAYRAEQRNRTR